MAYLKKLGAILGIVLIIFFGLMAVQALWGVFDAWGLVSSSDTVRSVEVSAVGEATVVPDTARFTFSVVTRGSDPDTIQRENADIANPIIEYLQEQGIAERDIQTVRYNLFPQYEQFGAQRVPVSYMLDQAVEVTVRDRTQAGQLLAGVVERGANQVSSLQFFVDDPNVFKREARAMAFERAEEAARELAEAAGMRLGKVITFSEASSQDFFPRVLGLGSADSAEIGVPQLQPGETEIRISISVTYEIR